MVHTLTGERLVRFGPRSDDPSFVHVEYQHRDVAMPLAAVFGNDEIHVTYLQTPQPPAYAPWCQVDEAVLAAFRLWPLDRPSTAPATVTVWGGWFDGVWHPKLRRRAVHFPLDVAAAAFARQPVRPDPLPAMPKDARPTCWQPTDTLLPTTHDWLRHRIERHRQSREVGAHESWRYGPARWVQSDDGQQSLIEQSVRTLDDGHRALMFFDQSAPPWNGIRVAGVLDPESEERRVVGRHRYNREFGSPRPGEPFPPWPDERALGWLVRPEEALKPPVQPRLTQGIDGYFEMRAIDPKNLTGEDFARGTPYSPPIFALGPQRTRKVWREVAAGFAHVTPEVLSRLQTSQGERTAWSAIPHPPRVLRLEGWHWIGSWWPERRFLPEAWHDLAVTIHLP